MDLFAKLPALRGELLLCRGCLAPASHGEAGLCSRCWEGLVPLPEDRCPRCALEHGEDRDCPEPTAWSLGTALWDYHGGRPPFGELLLPGIKAGERGWMRALLHRAEEVPLPEWDADLIVPAPTTPWRRLRRGFDLADAFARVLAVRLGTPRATVLRKTWRATSQTGRPESQRRRMPKKAVLLKGEVRAKRILLVDDVWTTGTTLLRCAQALQSGGAKEIRVLTLFRALRNS
ncbi:MAG: ComF family protein [Acidobacteria bacterium]|nr:ComF family protein [Acidobacteriota bacterium]